jgi:hypothetical protein
VARSGAKLLDRHDGPPELVDHAFKLALTTEGSNTTFGSFDLQEHFASQILVRISHPPPLNGQYIRPIVCRV